MSRLLFCRRDSLFPPPFAALARSPPAAPRQRTDVFFFPSLVGANISSLSPPGQEFNISPKGRIAGNQDIASFSLSSHPTDQRPFFFFFSLFSPKDYGVGATFVSSLVDSTVGLFRVLFFYLVGEPDPRIFSLFRAGQRSSTSFLIRFEVGYKGAPLLSPSRRGC